MDWGKGSRFLGRKLAGAGVLLALVLVCLFLVGLADPDPGLAGSVQFPVQERLPTGPQESGAVTGTVFLPFVKRGGAAASNTWQAEYYDNADLSGAPVRIAQEKRVDYDWEDGAPAGLPENYFSVRWSGDWDFEYGEYTFFVDSDDGVRLWLDGDLLIDAWQKGIFSERKKVVVKLEGPHHLRLEYFERTQLAFVRLHWRRTDLYPRWHGKYYRLPWAESGLTYEQVDDAIQFEWEAECPDLLPCDGFSVVWEAEPTFTSGAHRIYVYADDGYQLLIDDSTVQEGGWYDGQAGGGEDDYYKLEAGQVERHDVTYKFQDRGGLAEARLWIQDMEHPYWTVEYYDNRHLTGTPSATKTDVAIFHDWKWDSPHRSVYSDDFSVRWSGQRYFHAGCYRFGLFADDGVRLWVDGELLVDEWHDGRSEHYAPATYLNTGNHQVVVEYYEKDNEAEIRFWW
jgi:hypothetical protein